MITNQGLEAIELSEGEVLEKLQPVTLVKQPSKLLSQEEDTCDSRIAAIDARDKRERKKETLVSIVTRLCPANIIRASTTSGSGE